MSALNDFGIWNRIYIIDQNIKSLKKFEYIKYNQFIKSEWLKESKYDKFYSK